MGMTIDKAISWLVSIAEHEGEDIPIYDDDVKAISIATDIMRKYQKIEQIIKAWNDMNSFDSMVQISEVIKNGKAN